MRTSIFTCLFMFAFCCSRAQTNIDFESTAVGQYTNSNAVSGWTIESGTHTGTNGACPTNTNYVWNQPISEFSIVSTPVVIDPYIGIIGNSPLGGAHVAKLNDHNMGFLMTKIKTSFTVTTTNNLLELAYCGSWNIGGHTCCDRPFFHVRLSTDQGLLLPCSSFSATPSSPSCTIGVTYSTSSSGVSWTNWQVQSIDLSPYIGVGIVVEIINGDCDGGAHHGMAYVDARLSSQYVQPGLTNIGGSANFHYCFGSNSALLNAPLGYQTYSWTAPTNQPPIPPSQATLSSITVTAPIPGSIYTVNLTTSSGCQFVLTTTLAYSQVFIAGTGTSNSCLNGSTGSATVQGAGSGTGYTYNWKNSNGATVGTNSIVTGLAPGNYSVTVNSLTSASCGSAVAFVQIGVGPPPLQTKIIDYCSGIVSLQVNNGNNFQWFYNNIPLTNATSSLHVVLNPLNHAIYTATYVAGGCDQTTQFIINAVTLGTVSVLTNSVCPGATGGTATITLQGLQGSSFNFSVYSVGSIPAFSTSLNGSPGSNTLTGLTGGTTYSLSLNDLSCLYVKTFTAATSVPPFDFTISPQQASICANESFAPLINFSNASQIASYTYSWFPSTFITSSASQYSVIINPTVQTGNQSNYVYSVIVTPSQGICPVLKSVSFSVISLLNPTISPSPQLCDNGPIFTVQATPSGGMFSSNANIFISNTPVISPNLLLPGAHSFTYTILSGTCTAKSIDTIRVLAAPVLLLTGDTVLCVGETTTLEVSGGDTYLWSTSSTDSSMIITPFVNSTLTVTASDPLKKCHGDLIVRVRVEECANIGKIFGKGGMQLYPNPTHEKINIECEGEFSVTVFDSNGKLIKQISAKNKLTIDQSTEPNGIYLFRIRSIHGTDHYKMIKN